MPVKFKGRIQQVEVHKGRLTKAMDQALDRLVREAARAWVRAVIIKVPVWTGFAKGAIKFARGEGTTLGSFLRVAIPISPISKTPKWYYHHGTKIRKIPEKAGRFGKFAFSSSNHVYRFRFQHDVIYFLIEEFYGRVSPRAPWESFQAGADAFNKTINEGMRRLPKVKDFLVKREIKF